MNSGDCKYIWQAGDWPAWRFDLAALAEPMAQVSRAQGLLLGRLADVGMALRNQASLAALTEEVIKTSEIEGEQLNVESVRSSIARRLGVDIGALAPVDRHVEGVVEMVLDATANCQVPVSRERLFGWHAALFPTGYSGRSKIKVGNWRDDATGPMQVVSGPIGRQRVHFEAPPADRLEAETGRFLGWLNAPSNEPPLIKAGLGHLWFVTLHPFDDGNGRIARAIGDLLLSRADGSRFKVPQMGWNQVWQTAHGGLRHRLWDGVADGSFFYFVHSYYAQPTRADDGAATTEYGLTFTSAVARANIFATQFHPEKSAAQGLQLYRNFLHWQP